MTDIEKYKEDFESFIDEAGEYKIGLNFSRYPSEILSEMDEIAYNEQLEEYIEQKKSEFIQRIYQNFPAPIAYYFYQTEHGFENEHQRLHLLRDTWESVIYILYALVLGEVNFKNFSLTEIRLFNNQRIQNNHNGLMSDRIGWKLEAIYKILEYDQVNNNILKASLVIDIDVIEKLKELNQDRNSFSHTSALSPQEAKSRFDELYPKVKHIFFEFDFLENVSLLKYSNNLETVSNIRFFRFDGHSLQKHNYDVEFMPEEFTNIVPVLNQENLLIMFEDIFFNVKPFISFHTEGAHLKLCFYKKTERDTNEYLFEIIGGADREIKKDIVSINNCINSTLGGLL